MIIEFETWLTKDSKAYSTNPGTPNLQEYEYKFDKAGHKMLVKKDSYIPVYEKIQAERDSVNIDKLMERFVLGDKEALNRAPAYYLDTRDMPKTYMEVFERGLEAEQFFEALPVELKEKFDNSYSVFYSEMGNSDWYKKINEYNERFEDHKYDDESKDGGVTYNE